MLVGCAFHGLAGLGITPIGQHPVTMDSVVAATLEFLGNGGFAGAGNTFD
jgi:hypothetical protein